MYLIALQTRELSQKKNDINQQIKGNVLARHSYERQANKQIVSLPYILCCEMVSIKFSPLSTVCRADTAERRSYIETIHRDIKKLEEEIRVKQSTVIHNKANARRYDYW